MSDESEPTDISDDSVKDLEVKDDAAADATGKAGEGDTPKPGTPDKAMQKMQQELGNVTRQLETLLSKKDAEGQLSEADKAKLAKTQERIEKIRGFVNRPDRNDIPSEVDPVAEHVLDLSEKVKEQDDLKSQLAEANRRLQLLENDRNWAVARAKYSGLDVNAIWEKANGDALETLGDDGTTRAVNRLASKLFEERCEAAKKRLKDEPKTNNKSADQAAGYKVGSGQHGSPQLTEDEETLALARTLVVDN